MAASVMQIADWQLSNGFGGGVIAIRGDGMADAEPTVLIVDDDPAIRSSLSRTLRSVGLASAVVQIDSRLSQGRAPERSNRPGAGCELARAERVVLQRELAATNKQIPIIFITGHGDIPLTVQAMKGGAIEFLTKPFQDQDLLISP